MENRLNYECSICLNTLNDDKCNPYACNHYFHNQCIRAWSGSCPICRETKKRNEVSVKVNKNKYFDIENFKKIAPQISNRDYITKWKKKECISTTHNLTFHETYGVIGVCETCQTVQTFNSIN